jgi:hypothetical protein
MAILNCLYSWTAFAALTIVSDGALATVVHAGRPVASLTTKGLKWDLTNARSEFGGLVRSMLRLRLWWG